MCTIAPQLASPVRRYFFAQLPAIRARVAFVDELIEREV
jgi:hypothetical protein